MFDNLFLLAGPVGTAAILFSVVASFTVAVVAVLSLRARDRVTDGIPSSRLSRVPSARLSMAPSSRLSAF
jgi:hypothetical protein